MTAIRTGILAATAALALAGAAAGCGQSSQDMREQADTARDKASDAALDAEQKAREAARDAQQMADRATDKLDEAAQTTSIKAALIADKTVDASDINVDTFAETQTVVLRGSVPTAAQKRQAEQIAVRESDGFRIDNQLTVRTPAR